MKTDLHLKLEGYCRIMRRGEKHWFLDSGAPKLVHIPELAGPVTVKRALYAAFVGEIGDGEEVVAKCGTRGCVRPDHQKLVGRPSSRARGLSLPEHLAALNGPSTFREGQKVQILPLGLTVRKIQVVKLMVKSNSLEQIATATGLDHATIMRIKGGMYDDAVENVQGAHMASSRIMREARRRMRAPQHVPDLDPQQVPETVVQVPARVEQTEELEDPEADGEQQWLRMFKG